MSRGYNNDPRRFVRMRRLKEGPLTPPPPPRQKHKDGGRVGKAPKPTVSRRVFTGYADPGA
ncbi:MAG: hypothetical protein HY701_15075 [Gemmatimonadetes bacterium]|nr:hypothetical protein [Gemmatimonadota bacterium]